MDTMGMMLLGIVAGRFFPEKHKKKNERLQLGCTLLLIFLMGVGLGQREGFFGDLALLGFQSFLFFLIPTLLSVAVVYGLTRRLMPGTEAKAAGEPGNPRAGAARQWDSMMFFALGALILGIGCGAAPVLARALSPLTSHTQWILYLLMFSVGVSVGLRRGVWSQIRRYHVKILVIPAGITLGSLAGGVLCGLLTGYPLGQAVSVAGGMGWYSLAGVAVGNLAGASLGSIAFLSNLMREIGSFFMIPFIARHLNAPTCIAPAGATSEDTTLPMIMRYTNEATVVLSVLNGMICSFAVPVIIAFCY